jgi:hypothetical protein
MKALASLTSPMLSKRLSCASYTHYEKWITSQLPQQLSSSHYILLVTGLPMLVHADVTVVRNTHMQADQTGKPS